MKFFVVSFALLICGNALARPQEAQPQAANQPGSSTPITIVSQTEQINPDGSFKYSYETSNGIKVEQEGEIKNDPNAASAKSADGEETGSIQVLKGSFSYTDPEGKTILLKYVADEKGFQPEGDHLPTTPAVPAAIAKSLGQQQDQPQQPEAAQNSAAAQQPATAQQPAAVEQPQDAEPAASEPEKQTQQPPATQSTQEETAKA